MHPIAGNRRAFGLYAIAWVPLTALLVFLLRATGLNTVQALVLVVPMAPLYALMCLAAWYPCRATPIPKTGILRLATTHFAAGAQLSFLWMLIAMGYGYFIEGFETGFSEGLYPSRLAGLTSHLGLYKTVFGIGLLLYFLCAALQYVLIAMQRSQDAERRESEAHLLARDAELRALKAQINPHFLFNSLHSISALTAIDAGKARDMCITLADFLRKTLGLGQKELIPLSEELSLLHTYLTVEQVRFGNRLKLEEKFDDNALRCLVPPLLLQPLVENAIKHGIANLPEGGALKIEAHCLDGQVKIAIQNDFDPNYQPKYSNGIGIANVRERLFARYGDDATFDVTASGECYLVRLSLPTEKQS